MTLVVLIWGGNFAMVKTAFSQIGPLPFTAIRFSAATALLMLLLRWREGDCAFPREGFWRLFWLGVIGNTVYQALFATGLALTTSANAALVAWPVLGEKPTKTQCLGAILIIAGVLVTRRK